MADDLGADSLRYLPSNRSPAPSASTAEPALPGLHHRRLPDAAGQQLYQIALDNARSNVHRRAYETMQPAK